MYKREARIRVFEYFRAFKDVPQRTSVRPCCKVSVFRDHMTSCFLLWCIYLVLYVSLKNVCVCRLQTSRSPLLNTFFHAICISLFFHAKLSTFFFFVIIQFKANPMTSSQGYIFFFDRKRACILFDLHSCYYTFVLPFFYGHLLVEMDDTQTGKTGIDVHA